MRAAIRLLQCLALAIAADHTAAAWGPHSEITYAAIKVLPDRPAFDRLLDTTQLQRLCWLPDYHSTVLPEFTPMSYLLPPGVSKELSHVHPEAAQAFAPFFRRALQAIQTESRTNACRWVGSLIHYIQDSGSPPHTTGDGGEMHTRMENWVRGEDVSIQGYKPVILGKTLDEAVKNLQERMERNRISSLEIGKRIKPLCEAGNRAAVEPILLEAAKESARSTADVLATLISLAKRPAAGPNGSLEVIVTAPANPTRPQAPVKLTLVGTPYVTWSDPLYESAADHYKGSIKLTQLPAGEYRIRLEREGCHDAEITRVEVKRGALVSRLVKLEPAPPGVVIAHSPAKTQAYLGSPSIAVLPDGTYVASHDFFGPGTNFDTMRVYRSLDKGKTWKQSAEIKGQWWSSLFLHRGALYLLGTTKENGACVIRRSTDGGFTWTTPRDANSGLLLAEDHYHCAPVPVIVHKGRIWRAMEDTSGPGGWGKRFLSFMMSAPEDADLLKASNWTFSNRLSRDPAWLNGQFGGWLEGNAIVGPDGKVKIVLRADYRAGPEEKAAIIQVSEDGRRVEFDPTSGFVDMPGGCKKFTIRYDKRTKRYWTLSNEVPPEFKSANPERTRNTLSLMSSTDLRTWKVHRRILQHPDTRTHGFQYADWLFEGDDLIAVVRTAFDEADGAQAHNQHDSNYILFVRVKGFRGL